MASLIPVVQIAVSVAVLGTAIANANAQGLQYAVLPAPIGHAQPHEPGFAPRSLAEQEEQKRLSSFDAEQQKLDENLDKTLNICRC